MKKLLCVLLALAMLAAVLPVAALAADSGALTLSTLEVRTTEESSDNEGDGAGAQTITINMADSYVGAFGEVLGDGWYGNAIKVYADGTLVDTVTMVQADGPTATWSTHYDPAKEYSFHWVAETYNYAFECSFDILVGNDVVYSAQTGECKDYYDDQLLYTIEAQEDAAATKTIYFSNSNAWTDVYVYTYDSSYNPIGSAWPGDAMTHVTASIFRITVPADAMWIVFNNGNRGDGNQSHSQVIPENDRNLYIYGDVVWDTYSEDGDNVINYEDELYAALTLGGEYTLGNDLTIEPGWYYTVTQEYNVETVIDLGGYTLNSYNREIVVEAGSLTLKGGTISDTLLIVFGGSLTIQDVQITGLSGPLASGGNLELNNATVTVQDLAIYAVSGTLTINGGTYTITDTNNDFFDVEEASVSITGGTFGADVSEYVADGYECVPSGDMWVVQSKNTGAADDIKWQITNGTTAASESTTLRLITWADSLDYQSITFNVTIGGKTANITCETVYTAIKAADVTLDSAAAIFGGDAQYFVTYKIMNIPAAMFDEEIQVSVTWTDLAGNSTTSGTRTIVISEDWS